jgi:hypothetical protein
MAESRPDRSRDVLRLSRGRPLESERQAVEFGVEIGEYRGVVPMPRRVFQRLSPDTANPERCMEPY